MNLDHEDLEGRLRGLVELMPGPSRAATQVAQQALRRALDSRVTADGREARSRLGMFGWSRRRRLLLVGLGLLTAGGAIAASTWTIDDVPAGGRSSNSFVLPRTELLPGGYERSRPPRYVELPTRPALEFPAGTTYASALAQYYATRQAGNVIPSGVSLVDPLPAGRVIAIGADGTLRVDPAAPAGYDLWTGLVAGFQTAPTIAPAVPRCQVLLPEDAPTVADCLGDPNRAKYVRETANGWKPAPTEVAPLTQIVGTTNLSVLRKARTPADVLPPATVRALSSSPSPGPTPDTAQARLAVTVGDRNYYIVPAGADSVCLVVTTSAQNAGSTCNPVSVLVTFGAIPLNRQNLDGRTYTAAGIIGDGFSRVTNAAGQTQEIKNNVFVIEAPPGTKLTISGPAGTHRISVL